ncbi:hypothetical protein [Sphingobacterium sp. 1.A.5]|uniref:hypothetical protein n=1 Tax=Sphingobacterium sp. 1.A.5 TaxID=2044604 RepID=UPI000C0C0ABC|nr:hypothetical protein [Sphingobacterium sp. 1.A.5]
MKIKKKVQNIVDKVYDQFKQNESSEEYYTGVVTNKDVFYYYTLTLADGFDFFLPKKTSELIKDTYQAYLYNDLDLDNSDTKTIIETFNKSSLEYFQKSNLQDKEEKITVWQEWVESVVKAFESKISA